MDDPGWLPPRVRLESDTRSPCFLESRVDKLDPDRKKSDALDWLEKCYKDEDTWTVWIGVLVEWDSLRSAPRFINLICRLKLPF